MTTPEETKKMQDAVTLVKAGRKDEARVMLQEIIRQNPQAETAWLWFVETLPNPDMRIAALRECLRNIPTSESARSGLAMLGVKEIPTGELKNPAPSSPSPYERRESATPPKRAPEAKQAAPLSRLVATEGSQKSTPLTPAALHGKPPPPSPVPSTAARSKPRPVPRRKPAQRRPALSRSACLLRTCGCLFLLGLMASAVFAGVVFFIPGVKDPVFLAVNPFLNYAVDTWNRILPPETITPIPSETTLAMMTESTLTLPPPTGTFTPTGTSTPTRILPPTATSTPTFTSSPTLFQGVPGANDWNILFLVPGRCEVMSVSTAGGGPQSLTANPPQNCTGAEISPNGSRMAFIGLPDKNTIQMVNIDGSHQLQIFKIPDGKDFTRTIWSLKWSPNELKFALVAPSTTSTLPGFLYTLPSNGAGSLKQMKNGGIESPYVDRVAWSPDSRWIFSLAMAVDVPLSYPYAFRDFDSRSVLIAYREEFPSPVQLFHFDWSPDSRFISYVTLQKPTTKAIPTEVPMYTAFIVITGVDGSKKYIALPDNTFDSDFGARWSPDGSSFLLLTRDTHSLVIIKKDGTIENRVLTLSNVPSQVRWSPDGKWIAILERGNPGDTGGILKVVRRDGSEVRTLAYDVSDGPIVWKH